MTTLAELAAGFAEADAAREQAHIRYHEWLKQRGLAMVTTGDSFEGDVHIARVSDLEAGRKIMPGTYRAPALCGVVADLSRCMGSTAECEACSALAEVQEDRHG
jgi:hypothetical protein